MLVSLTHPSSKAVRLEPGALSIGRDPEADVFIDSPDVSRLHAMIRVMSDRIEVVDAKSSNGTFLNGNKVDRAVIQLGDVVRVGNEELRVVERPLGLDDDTAPKAVWGDPAGAQAEAVELLAEERRQLATLYAVSLRFLRAKQDGDPIALLFSLLDRIAPFDAAFVQVTASSMTRHHPAGLRLKDEDIRRLRREGDAQAACAFDGPDDSMALSNYRARSRVLIPLEGGGLLGMVSGVPGAYTPQLDFLAQIGRIVSAAIALSIDERTQ
jgi:hypothetical protein